MLEKVHRTSRAMHACAGWVKLLRLSFILHHHARHCISQSFSTESADAQLSNQTEHSACLASFKRILRPYDHAKGT